MTASIVSHIGWGWLKDSHIFFEKLSPPQTRYSRRCYFVAFREMPAIFARCRRQKYLKEQASQIKIAYGSNHPGIPGILRHSVKQRISTPGYIAERGCHALRLKRGITTAAISSPASWRLITIVTPGLIWPEATMLKTERVAGTRSPSGVQAWQGIGKWSQHKGNICRSRNRDSGFHGCLLPSLQVSDRRYSFSRLDTQKKFVWYGITQQTWKTWSAATCIYFPFIYHAYLTLKKWDETYSKS
jgi:hypothetical protein